MKEIFFSSCWDETGRVTANFIITSAPLEQLTDRAEAITTDWIVTCSTFTDAVIPGQLLSLE